VIGLCVFEMRSFDKSRLFFFYQKMTDLRSFAMNYEV
jgi:hypothetical protein